MLIRQMANVLVQQNHQPFWRRRSFWSAAANALRFLPALFFLYLLSAAALSSISTSLSEFVVSPVFMVIGGLACLFILAFISILGSAPLKSMSCPR